MVIFWSVFEMISVTIGQSYWLDYSQIQATEQNHLGVSKADNVCLLNNCIYRSVRKSIRSGIVISTIFYFQALFVCNIVFNNEVTGGLIYFLEPGCIGDLIPKLRLDPPIFIWLIVVKFRLINITEQHLVTDSLMEFYLG